MMGSCKNIKTICGLILITSIISFQNTVIASVKNQPQIIVKQQPQRKNSQPHPAFQAILPALKQKTQIKILLPKYIPESDGENPLYTIIETATKNKYEILLGFSPDCNGGSACRFSIITGEAITRATPRLTGKPVFLAKGVTGYFVDFRCGANCSDATLTWRQGGVQYRIGLKAGLYNSLIKMATSVISP
ncbi:hypothetical protein [Anabaena sp. UHCC 0204]|uniref:hypothetical protein n=1 Tax=Anabaena sp. UHCC 0204 TaxID=2590009 RepID=UPI00352C18C6